MAEASFTIRAVDSTRAAFASVQNSLSRMQSATASLARTLKGAFGLGIVAAALGKVNSSLENAEVNARKLGIAGEELDKLTIATNAADEAAQAVQRGLVKMTTAAVSGFDESELAARAAEIRFKRVADELVPIYQQAEELKSSLEALGASEEVMANAALARAAALKAEAEAIRGTDPLLSAQKINDALRLELDGKKSLLDIDKEYMQVREEFGQAQRAMQIREVSATEKLIGLNSRLGKLFFEFNDTADKSVITEKFKEMIPLMQQINKLQQEASQYARDAGDLLAQGFEDAILSGNKLSDVLKNLAQDLIRLIFRNVITAPLAGGISNAILGAFGFLAEGGPARAGSPYIVGEKGPELFVPGTSGTVIPNDRMTQMGASAGGPTVNISYNIQSGVSRAELQPILENERKRLKAEIPDMVRRGGSYRSAFA